MSLLNTSRKKINEYILYNDVSGSNSEITLSDSVKNYQYIEIFYGNASKSGTSSCKIFDANDKGFDMQVLVTADNYNLYINTCRARILNNKITLSNYGSNRLTTNNIELNFNQNSIYIYRVVAYKN